jgi:transposase InsO family protein
MKTLKREEIYANTYRDLAHLRTNLEAFIERSYNRDRLHSALGNRPPEEFERTMVSANTWEGATLRFVRHAEISRTDARGE